MLVVKGGASNFARKNGETKCKDPSEVRSWEMKIVVCSSMAFAREMIEARGRLEELGHSVTLPHRTDEYASGKLSRETQSESAYHKIQGDLFRDYFNKIKEGDSILVFNKDKNGIRDYIGGNTLIEMAFAHILYKPIYLLNPIPDISYRDEIIAMKPTIINEDFRKIK